MIHQQGIEGNDYHGVLLYDLHSSYTEMFQDPTWRPGFARSFTVVDFWQVDETGGFVTVKADKLIAEYNGFIDPQLGFGSLYSVHGSIADHRKLFTEFATACNEGPIGGDDDTFDYWPSAMDMLEVYARDLAKLGWTSGVGDLRGIAQSHMEVMEWEDEAARLMDLAAEDLVNDSGMSHHRA